MVSLLAAALAAPLPAQPTAAVLPMQGLQFGPLVPGVLATISPHDPSRAASFEVIGSGSVSLRIAVPASLETDAQRPLPLRFGPRDGRIIFPGSAPDLVFDPTAPVSFSIPPGSGRVVVFVGASAAPGVGQVPGSYSAALEVQLIVAAST